MCASLLSCSQGQPLNGDLRKCLKIWVAGKNCASKALSKRGNKAVQVTSAGSRFEPCRMKSQRTVNVDDFNGRCVDGRQSSDRAIKAPLVFQPVNDFPEIYGRHISRASSYILGFLDHVLYTSGSGLVLEKS